MIKSINIYDLVITLFIFFKMAEFPFFGSLNWLWLWVPIGVNVLHVVYNYFAITKGWQRNAMMLFIAKAFNLYYARRRKQLVKQYLKDDKKA